MKFNTAEKTEKAEAFRYFMRLANKRCVIEVKKINPNRTLNQNSYLHLIIGYFGVHFGYTLDEAKQVYKKINKSLYFYDKENLGTITTFVKSSADLSKEDMAISIDRFMEVSKENGCPLPPATDKEWLRSIENSIEQSNYYSKGGL